MPYVCPYKISCVNFEAIMKLNQITVPDFQVLSVHV